MLKEDNLRIAVDARELKIGQITGIGRFLRNFLDNLTADQRSNICLLTDNNDVESIYKNSFKIIKMDRGFTLWLDQISIPKILKNEAVDIFFSPYYKMPFRVDCKRIITIHDLHFLSDILRRGLSRFKPFVVYLKQAINSCDKIITVSNFSKEEIIKKFKVDEDKIKVIYNGIDNKFRILGRNIRQVLESKYKINFKYILYVGNMLPHKNIKGLIEAYGMLGPKKQDCKLIIIAKKDNNFRALQKLTKQLSLEDNILFFDFVPDEDLVLFYNFSEIFVFPSFYEGFGLPPLEAMACGAPVISSYTTSLKEILGEGAVYINPYNIKDITEALANLLNNIELREAFKNKGLTQARKYDSVNFSHNLLQEIMQT